ncbi:MAG: hypothetical protein EB141_16735, partial [Verrucomicrobia bacterium]|nr:hypothetical protein [Verrucomicrobiota bacterium]
HPAIVTERQQVEGRRHRFLAMEPAVGANPAGGERPTDSTIASVSVVHTSTMHADALGTGLTVLGFEKAWALAQREKLGVLFILRDGERLTVRATEWWPREAKTD